MSMLNLINALNEHDFMAFPQKENAKRVTLSAKADGKRYFITRMSTDMDEQGKPTNWEWRTGEELQKQSK